MNGTNVDYYVAGFDADGKRVGSLIFDGHPDDAQAVADAVAKGKTAFAGAAVVEVISADDYGLYLSGDYVRGTDGTPVLAAEPTDAEKLALAKTVKLTDVQRWTAAAITGGFISAGVRYDSDTDTQITMQGICLAVDTPRFAEEYPQGCPVRGYDEDSVEKTIHMLDAAGVKAFCADLSAHIGTCKQKGWQLQQAVAAAETIEAVNTITWPEE